MVRQTDGLHDPIGTLNVGWWNGHKGSATPLVRKGGSLVERLLPAAPRDAARVRGDARAAAGSATNIVLLHTICITNQNGLILHTNNFII